MVFYFFIFVKSDVVLVNYYFIRDKKHIFLLKYIN